MFNFSPIGWKSRKLKRVANSTTEAEVMEANMAVRKVEWTRHLISFIFPHAEPSPTPFFGDNNNAIDFSRLDKVTDRTKHFIGDYFYVRQARIENSIDPQKVPSDKNVADVFTKPLSGQKFADLRCSLRVLADREVDLFTSSISSIIPSISSSL